MSTGLADWTWLDLGGKVPVMVSTFGHVFLQDTSGIWFLDPIEGDVTLEWPDVAAMNAVLSTATGRDTFLLEGLVLGAEHRSIARGPHQIYVFTPPPILSRSFAFEHIMAMDFGVGMSVQGQLHRQLRWGPEPLG